MGLVAGRGQNQNTQLAGTSQSLFIETCEDCGAPVTIVSARRPNVLRCSPCTAAANAAAAAAAASPDAHDDEPSEA